MHEQKKALGKAQQVSAPMIKKEASPTPSSMNQSSTNVLTDHSDMINVNSASTTSSVTNATVTPSPVISSYIRSSFDHIQGRDLFGPGEFCPAC